MILWTNKIPLQYYQFTLKKVITSCFLHNISCSSCESISSKLSRRCVISSQYLSNNLREVCFLANFHFIARFLRFSNSSSVILSSIIFHVAQFHISFIVTDLNKKIFLFYQYGFEKFLHSRIQVTRITTCPLRCDCNAWFNNYFEQ